MFFNCKADSIKDTLSKKYHEPHQAHAAFYQNLFDNGGLPAELELDIEKIMETYSDRIP